MVEDVFTRITFALFDLGFAFLAMLSCVIMGEFLESVCILVIKSFFRITTNSIAHIEHTTATSNNDHDFETIQNVLVLEIPIEESVSLKNTSLSSGYNILNEQHRRGAREKTHKRDWFPRIDYHTMDYFLFVMKWLFRLLGIYLFFDIIKYDITKIVFALGLMGYIGAYATAQIIRKILNGFTMRLTKEPAIGTVIDWQGHKVKITKIGSLRTRLDEVTEVFDTVRPILESSGMKRRKKKGHRGVLAKSEGSKRDEDKGTTTSYSTIVRRFRIKHEPLVAKIRKKTALPEASESKRVEEEDNSVCYKFSRYFLVPNDIMADYVLPVRVLQRQQCSSISRKHSM